MATDFQLQNDRVEIIADGVQPTSERVICRTTDVEVRGGPTRSGMQQDVMRRAIVHGEGDKLILNFAGDYNGGVRVDSALECQALVVQGGVFVFGGAYLSLPVTLLAGDGAEIPSLNKPYGTTYVKKIDLLNELQVLREKVAELSKRLDKISA